MTSVYIHCKGSVAFKKHAQQKEQRPRVAIPQMRARALGVAIVHETQLSLDSFVSRTCAVYYYCCYLSVFIIAFRQSLKSATAEDFLRDIILPTPYNKPHLKKVRQVQ